MKKKINPFILIPIAFTVIAVIAISSVLIYNYSLGYKVKEHTKSGEITAIDVNGGGAMDLFLWNKGKKDYRVLASYPNSNGTIKPLGR